MLKTVVYEGENILGEVEILFEKKSSTNWNNGGVVEDKEYEYDVEILRKGLKISELSKGGERCHPLAVLHTICSSSSSNCVGFCFKMIEHKSLFYHHQQQHQQQDSSLLRLHSTCIRENKTAVVPFGEQEIHLVAMRSTRIDTRIPCFWGFIVAPGLYESCLGMLNLRCLGIVFDLDETLIVANTLRSFEDRIDALQRKISAETDSQRVAGMVAEVKRYQDDKAILKQYAETDQVVDNGKVHKIQAEVVPALSDNHQTVVRPLIRLQDKNIVLTRINPQIRDTSVLVRLRPAWEDLRSYLTARGRKRFEVYVCTMAERDYALEMWRLLDPDSNLISTGEVLDRIVCVKSGSKKSLFNVFHDGICHPKMALVIDDRLKVWDDEDQPRVHVVPAFAPYYAPQAEANNAIPVLCVARNVACNVRGGFFKDFDDILLQRILEVSFEGDIRDVPSPPDVSNYLVSEDDGTGTNSNKEALCFDGMADAEVERRLKEAVLASSAATSLPSAPSSASINVEPRLQSSLSFPVAAPSMMIPQPAQTLMTSFPANLFSQAGSLVRPLGNLVPQELTLRSSPAPEEGEVSESEVDPDTRRRLLILQHGQDFRDNLQSEAPFSIRPAAPTPTAGPAPVPGALPVAGPGPGPGSVPAPIPAPGPGPGPVPRMQSRGSWFPVDDHMNPGHLNRPAGKEFPIGPDSLHMEKQRPPPPFQRRMENPVRSDRSFPEKQRPPREAPRRDDRIRSNHSLPNHQSYQGDDLPSSRSSSNKEFEVVPKRGNSLPESPAAALHEIAVRCGTKVEFRSGLVASTELRFLMEAYFSGERIGEGAGAKRREAQHRAAEAALMNLADRYLIHVKSDSSPPQSDTSRGQSPSNTGYPGDANSPVDRALIKDEVKPAAEVAKQDDPVLDEPKESDSSVLALKELCMKEGLVIDFRAPSPSRSPINNIQGDEIYAEAKIDGQVFGKGAGSTWDEAKIQAADQALASLKSTLGQSIHKRPASPRLVEGMPIKRLKPDLPQVLQRLPSSRYPRNASPVP